MESFETQQHQRSRVILPGSLIRMMPKAELPEDVKPYGHIIPSLDAYRRYQQTSLDITVFNKGTVGILVEHGKDGNQAVILIQDKLYSVHYQFLEAVKAVIPPENV